MCRLPRQMAAALAALALLVACVAVCDEAEASCTRALPPRWAVSLELQPASALAELEGDCLADDCALKLVRRGQRRHALVGDDAAATPIATIYSERGMLDVSDGGLRDFDGSGMALAQAIDALTTADLSGDLDALGRHLDALVATRDTNPPEMRVDVLRPDDALRAEVDAHNADSERCYDHELVELAEAAIVVARNRGVCEMVTVGEAECRRYVFAEGKDVTGDETAAHTHGASWWIYAVGGAVVVLLVVGGVVVLRRRAG